MIDASPSADDPSMPAKSTPEAELQALYEQVDREVARYGPACQLSGRCCRFKEYAHTLFASTVEIRYLVAAAPEPSRPLDRGETCPWQDERGRCTARDAQPLGCRIFYCDPAYQNRPMRSGTIHQGTQKNHAKMEPSVELCTPALSSRPGSAMRAVWQSHWPKPAPKSRPLRRPSSRNRSEGSRASLGYGARPARGSGFVPSPTHDPGNQGDKLIDTTPSYNYT